MRSSGALVAVFFAAALIALPAGAQSIIIDTFETDQSLISVTSNEDLGNFVDGTGILQTERNMRIQTGTVGPGGEVSASVGVGLYILTRASNANGTVTIWWDGNNSTTTLSQTGLGGVDLTAGGQTRFRVTTGTTNSTTESFTMTVYTNASNSSAHIFTLPAVPGTVELLYSNFVVATGTGANFASVGAITLSTTDASGFWTPQLDDIRTVPVELQSFSVD